MWRAAISSSSSLSCLGVLYRTSQQCVKCLVWCAVQDFPWLNPSCVTFIKFFGLHPRFSHSVDGGVVCCWVRKAYVKILGCPVGNTDYVFWNSSSSSISDCEEQIAPGSCSWEHGLQILLPGIEHHSDASGLTALGKDFDTIHFSAITYKLEATTTPAH